MPRTVKIAAPAVQQTAPQQAGPVAQRARPVAQRARPAAKQAVPVAPQAGVAAQRQEACLAFLRDANAILAKEGSTPSALHELKLGLTALAERTELFPLSDFPMPLSEGRLHTLVVEDNDGLALHLLIGKPGKMSNPHTHSIWCINASVSGRERHTYWRRTDDGSKPGYATVKKVGEMVMERGRGFAMGDLDIHSQEVLGDEPSVILALYGHSFQKFPSVIWYNQEFSTVRKLPSMRGATAA